jgi:hypothetical protein
MKNPWLPLFLRKLSWEDKSGILTVRDDFSGIALSLSDAFIRQGKESRD